MGHGAEAFEKDFFEVISEFDNNLITVRKNTPKYSIVSSNTLNISNVQTYKLMST